MAGHTRRELILRGATASLLAGFAAAAAAGGADATDPQGNGAELQSLAAIEQLCAFAYAHVLSAASLSPASTGGLRSFLAQEHEHVRLLEDRLTGLGLTSPPAPTDVDRASQQLNRLDVPGSLRDVKTEDDALRYLIGVETLAEGAYYSAMSRLSDTGLLVLAAEVMSCEAQHWTALSGLLHAGDVYRAVPYPVVLG